MKELERTKRISISAILFLLIIVVGLLTFRKPEFSFSNSSEKTLETVVRNEHIITLDEFQKMDPENYLLLDVRNSFDFSKGHIENAFNVPMSQILNTESIAKFKKSETLKKQVILYAEHPQEANASWLLLYQLGYEGVKVLSAKTFYHDRHFYAQNIEVGKPSFDYAMEMKKASIQKVKNTPVIKPQPVKKKVITQPKKKKRAPEGGC